MFLLIGLGNPGKEYSKTRHNLGFLALDAIIDEFNLIEKGQKFESELFAGEINSHKIIAAKPQTYMNLSGSAVQKIAQFYKIPPEKIIIFHDEIDINFLEIRIKQGGGHAGHNGLKSIDANIGKNYWRFRLGISRPPNPAFEVSDYVLSKFSATELQEIEQKCQEIAKSLPNFLDNK